MLILVAVTVSYSIKSGLLSKAKDATSGYTYQDEEAEIGQIRLEYAVDSETKDETTETLKERLENELTGEADVTENAKYIIITYKETQNQHKISKETDDQETDWLADYLLGEDRAGKDLYNELINTTEMEFYDAEKVKLKKTNDWFGGTNNYYVGENRLLILYCTYEGKLYKFGVIYETSKTIALSASNPVQLATYQENKTSMEGKYVYWDTNGDGTVDEKWIVLYDDDSHGLQIISANGLNYNSGKLTLGAMDTYLKYTSSKDVNNTITSYNKAVATLNAACKAMVTNETNVLGVRSVGSNPSNPTSESNYNYSTSTEVDAKVENGIYSSSKIAESYGIKPGDLNAIEDYEQMVGLNITTVPEKFYWMASRYIEENPSGTTKVSIRYVNGIGTLTAYDVLDFKTTSPTVQSTTRSAYLRPVVTLDKDKVEFGGTGTGTSDDPYTLINK